MRCGAVRRGGQDLPWRVLSEKVPAPAGFNAPIGVALRRGGKEANEPVGGLQRWWDSAVDVL